MSWQIPTQIEQDIICGKAAYKTFQTGNGGQSVLPVPPNSYIVIFGYDFSPAGGGIVNREAFGGGNPSLNSSVMRWFETQQISFYTGADFFPFIHHVNIEQSVFSTDIAGANFYTVDNSPIARQVYITSNQDVAITVGLILQVDDPVQSAIPVTDTTPFQLTYGGSGQVINVQTTYSQGGTQPTFIQPALKDYDKYSLPALPANVENQVFAGPDAVNGLIDPSTYLNSLGVDFNRQAACNYYLCLHYAVYNKTVPEQRG
jgi:hypothetical protein